ncbi:MAG: tetratricopeptide repeat protein [Cyanobacteria bacterium REEB67]|nr:tetratricopeptide repeat protein [Cyanobacteria bacterium REEB67]
MLGSHSITLRKGSEKSFPALFAITSTYLAICLSLFCTGQASAQSNSDTSAATEFSQAQTFAAKSQYISAVKHYNKAIAAAPNNITYRYQRGLANLQLHCADEALKDFEFCRARNPNMPINSKLWAAAYRAADQFQPAIEQYTIALKSEPKKTQADVYYDRAQTYLEHDKYALAAADYTSAISLRPYEERYYRERAKCHEAMKDYAGALSDYDLSLKANPGNKSIYLSRALCYSQLGKYKESIDDYARAIAAKPNDAKAYAMRAKTYQKMGRNELAEKDRKTARELGEMFHI